jgi:hypothetical protein
MNLSGRRNSDFFKNYINGINCFFDYVNKNSILGYNTTIKLKVKKKKNFFTL